MKAKPFHAFTLSRLKGRVNGVGLNVSVGLGSKFRTSDVLTLVFLIGNLVIRFGTIFYYPPYNQ